ncbi:hypothetical protein EWM64_g349 [Hericium alpestre]|uniref:Uncharacterized protein n=1 Tax=Hericium alpestre TaxID=135208 RepID=A0A4Z0A9B0_9AGAM|nr:hypothetical protein EWM64_g349 [Hericium alpestre]
MSQQDNVKAAEFLRAESELVLDEVRLVLLDLPLKAELTRRQKRKRKAEKFKTFGNPIELNGVPIDVKIDGNHAWLAENTSIIRKLDLETGKSLKIFKGHSGPVTALAFCDMHPGSGDKKVLITGSWDMVCATVREPLILLTV